MWVGGCGKAGAGFGPPQGSYQRLAQHQGVQQQTGLVPPTGGPMQFGFLPPAKRFKGSGNPGFVGKGNAPRTSGDVNEIGEVRFFSEDVARRAVEQLGNCAMMGQFLAVTLDPNDVTKVLVSSMPAGIAWQELKDHFAQVGEVHYANIGKRSAEGIVKGGGKGGSSCFTCGEIGHRALDCPQRPVEVAGKGKGGACFKCGEVGHRAIDCPQTLAESASGGRIFPAQTGGASCFICGELGHRALDCPQRSSDSVKCFRCGEYGHRANDCPQLPADSAAGGKGGGACFICGEFSHRAIDCPRRSDSAGAGKGGCKGGGSCFTCGEVGHRAIDCPHGSGGSADFAGGCKGAGKGGGSCFTCGEFGHRAIDCPQGGGGSADSSGKGFARADSTAVKGHGRAEPGRPCVGEVRYYTKEDADRAIELFNGVSFREGTINVRPDLTSPNGTKILVFNVPVGTDFTDLQEHFAQAGQIAFCGIDAALKGKGKHRGDGKGLPPAEPIPAAGSPFAHGSATGGPPAYGNVWRSNTQQPGQTFADPIMGGGSQEPSSGSGFALGEVRFDCSATAQQAIALLNGSTFQGSTVSVVQDGGCRDGSRVLVFGVPPDAERQDLKVHFEQAGRVEFCGWKGKGQNQKGCGKEGCGKAIGKFQPMNGQFSPLLAAGDLVGEVRFDSPATADQAILLLSGGMMNGAKITVEQDGTCRDASRVLVSGVPEGTHKMTLRDHFAQVGKVVFAGYRPQSMLAPVGPVAAPVTTAIFAAPQAFAIGGAPTAWEAPGGSPTVATQWEAPGASSMAAAQWEAPSGFPTAATQWEAPGSSQTGTTQWEAPGSSPTAATQWEAPGTSPAAADQWEAPSGSPTATAYASEASSGAPPVAAMHALETLQYSSPVAPTPTEAGQPSNLVGEVIYNSTVQANQAVQTLNGSYLRSSTLSVHLDASAMGGGTLTVYNLPTGCTSEELQAHFADTVPGAAPYVTIVTGARQVHP